MIRKKSSKEGRNIRHQRGRKTLMGTSSVPRLCVFKSSNHIYAQIIDDVKEHTLVAASSLTPKVREILKRDKRKKADVAKIVGRYIGEIASLNGIVRVCFDRGGYLYSGRIKALADGVRETGLQF